MQMQIETATGARRQPRMENAGTYEEWKAAALARDQRTGAARWRRVDESGRYDYNVIRRRLENIRQLRSSGVLHSWRR